MVDVKLTIRAFLPQYTVQHTGYVSTRIVDIQMQSMVHMSVESITLSE